MPPWTRRFFDDQHVVRFDQIILHNVDVLKDRRILDVGGNVGHFLRLAVYHGAYSATCLEPRAELRKEFDDLWLKDGLNPEQSQFVTGSASELEILFNPRQFDTIMCLGMLYHIHSHPPFLKALAALQPQHLILDTVVSASDSANIELDLENSDWRYAGFDDHRPWVLRGTPSRKALDMMLSYCDWETVGKFDFAQCPIPGNMLSIRNGQRVIAVCRNSRPHTQTK